MTGSTRLTLRVWKRLHETRLALFREFVQSDAVLLTKAVDPLLEEFLFLRREVEADRVENRFVEAGLRQEGIEPEGVVLVFGESYSQRLGCRHDVMMP